MRIIAAALAACAASACASFEENWLTEKEMATFQAGGQALLVLDEISQDCHISTYAFWNYDAQKGAYRFVDKGEAAAVPTAPGKHGFLRANCLSGYDYPDMDSWFDTFEVKAGEVIYPGTVEVSIVTMQKQASTADKILTLGLASNETDAFAVYEIRDNSAAVRERLRARSPEMADRMVVRIPRAILSREAVTTAYQKAYAPKPDGTLPTPAEVDARFQSEIRIAVVRSLAEYVRSAPKPAAPATATALPAATLAPGAAIAAPPAPNAPKPPVQ